MRSSFVLLLLMPAFIVLGHDIYLFWEDHLNPGVFSLGLLMENFKFSSLGFLWTNYLGGSYEAVAKAAIYVDPCANLVDAALESCKLEMDSQPLGARSLTNIHSGLWPTIDFILTFKTFFVCLVFAGAVLVSRYILQSLGLYGEKKSKFKGSKKKGKDSLRAGSQSKRTNYNRK